jgi:MYXO-CTERM domain-containing protein
MKAHLMKAPLMKAHLLPLLLLLPLLVSTTTILATEKRAHAATINVANEISLPRLDAAGNQTQKRNLTQQPEAISRRDCDDDQRIRFTVQLADFEVNGVLQAWVSLSGQSCVSDTARFGSVATCWRAFPGDIPLQSTINVDIPVRNLMSGAPPSLSPMNPTTDKSVCGKVDRTALAVQFLYFTPGTTTPSDSKMVIVEADTVGPSPAPSPPSSIARTSDPRGVNVVSPDAPRGAPGSNESESLRVFCKQIEAGEIAACSPEAIFGKTAGTDLVPDQAFEQRFACDSGQASLPNATTHAASNTAFENAGVSFAFSLAKVDGLGNISGISNPKCVTLEAPLPPASTDSDDDGCSTARVGSHSSSSSSLIVVLAALLAITRRRRSVSAL